MEVIFLLGASQAFLLAFLVFAKKNKSNGDYVLGSWLAFMGLELLNHYFYATDLLLRYPHLIALGITFSILQGPFMFIYVSVMMNKSGKFKREYWLHAIPFVLFNLYFLWDFFFLSATEKLAYYNKELIDPSLAIEILGILSVSLGPIYVIWSLIKLRKHIKMIAENFSYTEQINLNWLRYVLGGLGFVWVTVIIADVLDTYSGFNEDFTSDLIYLSVTLAVFFLGYFGIKQQAIYVHSPASISQKNDKKLPAKKKEGERYKHSGLKKSEAEVYLKELIEYIENEKPYLNGKLSLKELAAKLDLSVNHLSQIINEQLNKSFFDFINAYRVEEVISRLSDPKNEQYTLLAIAYDSGFNSKSSFNSIFKKFTNLTPSEYLKQK